MMADVVEGKRTGKGTYTWADGNRYEGDFDDNTLHGRGTYIWTDGRTYVGQFERDRRHGQGKFTWPNNDVYEGEFLHGQRTGQGTRIWQGEAKYSGSFLDGKLHGSGRYEWQDGRQYIGQYEDGVKSGPGEFIWPNGNRYVGDFAADVRHGVGVFFWRDGTVYRGHFVANKMHGWGVKKQPDEQLELQHWVNGELQVSQRIEAVKHCGLQHDQRAWMFDGRSCINGLAHGLGVAASLDGNFIVAEGRFVLGTLVSGDVLRLPLDPLDGSKSEQQPEPSVDADNSSDGINSTELGNPSAALEIRTKPHPERSPGTSLWQRQSASTQLGTG